MFDFLKKGKEFYAPVTGSVIDIENVNDKVFSKKMMGEGIAFNPDVGVVSAPIDSVVTATLDSNHAIGLTTTDGIEYIIHIGLDTVECKGNGFKRLVNDGDKVVQGTKLIEFDIDFLKKNNKDITTILIVSNKEHSKVSKKLKQGDFAKTNENVVLIIK